MDARCPRRKNRVYRIDDQGNLIVRPKFAQLWDLLTNGVGDSNYMGGYTTTSFSLPSLSQSVLRGAI